MNPIHRQLINHKINTITPEELMSLARQYQVPITKTQAIRVVKILRKEQIDIANRRQRERILNQIGIEVGIQYQLMLQQLIDRYLK